MRISGPSIVFLFIAFNLKTFGQKDQQLNKEIGLSFFTIEMNSETLNHGLEPKFVYGVYFNQYLSNLSWISSLEFGINVLNDDCIHCMDTFYGDGKMEELIISTGLRYTFIKQKTFLIKPFIESDLYYSYLLYRGDFDGGESGYGTKIDNASNIFGILLRAGLLFNPIPRISLSISSSYRIGTGRVRNYLLSSTDKIISASLAVLQLRLGYYF